MFTRIHERHQSNPISHDKFPESRRLLTDLLVPKHIRHLICRPSHRIQLNMSVVLAYRFEVETDELLNDCRANASILRDRSG
mgnify:CR=1 FL=1